MREVFDVDGSVAGVMFGADLMLIMCSSWNNFELLISPRKLCYKNLFSCGSLVKYLSFKE
jgi:hypothetical protein